MQIKKTTYKNILLLAVMLIAVKLTHAQSFIDTTDRRVTYYRASIANNKNKVQFIEQILQNQGVPKALRNLALIESDFKTTALSSAKAAGTWQIMPGTASTYGLKTNTVNDERYDLFKSTYTASQLLRDLYDQYNDWLPVIAAYSCGKGGVHRAIEKAGSNNFYDYYKYLPNETIMHVYKFTMACYATGELGLLNSKKAVTDTITDNTFVVNNPGTVSTSVCSGYDLAEIASGLQMSLSEIETLNPNYIKELAATGTTQLQLPIDKMPDFLLMKNEILRKSLAKTP